MANRAKAKALAAIQDRERGRLEAEGIRIMRRLGFRFRVAMLRAVRAGGDLHQPIEDLIRSLEPVMSTGMMAGHLQGRLRSVRSAQSVAGKSLTLASGDPYKDAMAFLNSRLATNDNALEALTDRYTGESSRVLRLVKSELTTRVDQALAEVTRQNLPTRSAVQVMRQQLEAAGITNTSAHLIETTVRTQTQIAYTAGRINANEDPAVQEILWGYEYTAVGDDRTTPICTALDGMRRPKADHAWQRFMPPNHYNCRSSVIEIFNDEQLANPTPIPGVSPLPGFDFNPGAVFKDLLAA